MLAQRDCARLERRVLEPPAERRAKRWAGYANACDSRCEREKDRATAGAEAGLRPLHALRHLGFFSIPPQSQAERCRDATAQFPSGAIQVATVWHRAAIPARHRPARC